jgi:hypothetical protein
LCLSGGGAVILPGGCAEALDDPCEMVHPVHRGPAGVEGILEAEVETLHHPVRLQVVCCHMAVLDVEQVEQGSPQGGGELGPAV